MRSLCLYLFSFTLINSAFSEVHPPFLRTPSVNDCFRSLWISNKSLFKDHPIPTTVNLSEFLKQSTQSFYHPAKVLDFIQESSGNFAMLDLVVGKILVISDTKLAVEIMKNTNRDANSPFVKSEIVQGPFSGLVGRNNIFSEDDFQKWAEKRKKFGDFFKPKVAEDPIVQAKIKNVVNRRIEKLVKLAANENGAEVDLKQQMASLTLEILLDSFFTKTILPGELDSINNAFEVIMHSFPMEAVNPTTIALHQLPTLTTYQKKLKQAHQVIDQFVQSMIDERLKISLAERPDDLFTQMIAYFEEHKANKNRGSLVNEIKTFILSGHETTSSGLTWVFYRLMKETPILARPETNDAILSLWNETLFKYPPAYVIARKAVKDFEMVDELGRKILIPEGMEVIVPLTNLHKAFGDYSGHSHKASMYAFGTGPRICLGRFFADAEAQIILNTFLNEFNFHPLFDAVKNTSSGSLQVAEKLPVRITRRKIP